MSRPGISFEDVAEAAHAIQLKGEIPTIVKIRTILGGTGSNTTISKYLTEWRYSSPSLQSITGNPAAAAPDIVKAAVDRVWQQMREQTEADIEEIKTSTQRLVETATNKAEAAETDRIQTQSEYQQLQETFQALSAEKELLWLDLKRLHEEHAQLNERHQTLNTRYKDMESGLTRHLRELAESHQAELTRLEQLQLTQQTTHQHFISTLTEQHENLRQQMIVDIDALKVTNQKEQKNQAALRVQLQDKITLLATLEAKLCEAEQARIQYQQHLDQQQIQIKQLQNKTLVADDLLARILNMPKFDTLLHKLETHYMRTMQDKMLALEDAISSMKIEKAEALNA
jgi:DNA repair exonuclease SbcCD ATPase subunit